MKAAPLKTKPPTVIYHGNWTEFERRRRARDKKFLPGEPIPAANIGQRHPDYGMTVAEHLAAKAARR